MHTKQWARIVVYWPGIDNDVDNVTYRQCQERLMSLTRELIVIKPRPDRPFRRLSWISVCMQGMSSSLWWMVTLTGDMSSTWAATPLHPD